jgi:UPF0176 protein
MASKASVTASATRPAPVVVTHAPYEVLLFYKFLRVPDPELLRQEQFYLCDRLDLKGRIFVADEGINGTLSGPREQTEAYRFFMSRHPLFKGIEFKVDPHTTHAFHKLHVRVKDEIVSLDLPQTWDPGQHTAPYVEPAEMVRLLREQPEDVVLLDTRSRYEFELGRFKGAVTLPIEQFRELPAHMEALEALKGKKIITYCTGGIRCEKVTGWLIDQGFQNVHQLHGGIIRYGHEAGGEGFEGKCYVFDSRVAVDVNRVDPSVVGVCKQCGTTTEHSINCANAECNDKVLLCMNCADTLSGCCSPGCVDSPQRRVYDGTGKYYRGINSKVYADKA